MTCPPPSPATPPVTQDAFKAAYGLPKARDFKFGDGADTVMDSDLARAFDDAMGVYAPRLFGVAEGQKAFMYLVAHYVRTNIEAVGGLQAAPEGLGVQNQAEQVVASAGAGGVNQAFVEPPDRVKKNPIFLSLWVTSYGRNYVNLALIKTIGNVGVVEGTFDVGTATIPATPFADI